VIPLQQSLPFNATCVCGDSSCFTPYGLCHCGCGGKTLIADRNKYDGSKWVQGKPRPYIANHHKNTHRHATRGKEEPIYKTWRHMIDRCTNPNSDAYKDYGGRGITICDRWRKFENFLADMGERPESKTIDRYPDKNGNYEPGNCRWATWKEQQNNRRSNRVVEFLGEMYNITQLARKFGMQERTLKRRIDEYGMSVEEAATRPVIKGHYGHRWN
jgi:AraC-like DNA-binding protein